MKKICYVILALSLILTGKNILGASAEVQASPRNAHTIGIDSFSATNNQFVTNSQYRVNLGGTEVRRFVTQTTTQTIAVIPAGATFTRVNNNPVIIGNWTWIQGRLSGTAAQTAGITSEAIWISTSQLTRINGGANTTCTITDPQRFGHTSVRHAPGTTNGGEIFQTGATFRPTGDATVVRNGWTWRLGTITGTAAQTNGWNNRVVWVSTSQFAANSPCR